MKIGIFGGTFNPVHVGHLRTVEEVRTDFNLEIVYFVLAKLPPHKSANTLVSANERYEILKYALSDNPFFKTSSIELRRKKTSYSIDTIKFFKKKFSNDELYFILGSDAFLEIKSWFKYEELLQIVDIVVMFRENFICNDEFLSGLGYSKKNGDWVNIFNKRIFLTKVTRFDISSSLIRDKIIKNKSIRYFLPEKCVKYITKKNLYKGTKKHGK